MKKLTPVLCVESIEESLSFWVERLGFEKLVEIAEGDRLGFVLLNKGGVELMYQTRTSIEKDVPGMAKECVPSKTSLYIEVDDFDDVVNRLHGADIVIPIRRAPYGAVEIGVREPAGNVVVFAKVDQPPVQ